MAKQVDLSRKIDVRRKCPNTQKSFRTFRTKNKKCPRCPSKSPNASDTNKA